MPNSNAPPPNLPIVKDSNTTPSLNRPLPPVPSLNSQTPTSLRTSPASGTLPLKSFIRSMEDDLKSAKQGLVSKGVEVTIPKTPPLPSFPETGVQNAPKPSTFAPLVKIGEAEKRSLLPGMKLPPLPPSVKKEISSPIIAVPPKKGGFLNKTLILALFVAVLAGGGAYWFFVIKQETKPEVVPTFTPRVITSDSLNALKKYFFINSSISLPDSTVAFDLSALKSALLQVVPNEEVLHSFAYLRSGTNAVKFSEFIKRFLSNQEETSLEVQSLINSVSENGFGLIFSKQTEKFDDSGKPVDNSPVERRLAFVIEVSDLTAAKQAMSDWETNLPFNIESLFELTKLDEVEDLSFKDNVYRETTIRFVNFPYPDRSIDYALISANDGKQYLVIANSRAQMYGVIDALLGF